MHTFQPFAVPCEAARYGAAILYLPDLWVDARAWRGWAGFLGHRGWEGWLVPLRELDGGIEARAAVVAEFVRGLPAPPVLLGDGAGGAVATSVARQVPLAAVVLLAPFVPGVSALGTLLARWDALWPLLTNGRVPPPSGAVLAGLRAPIARGAEDDDRGLSAESAAVLLDLARARVAPAPITVRSVVVSGDGDRLTPVEAARGLAHTLGSDFELLPGRPHWLSAHPDWQRTAGWVHRWLVRGLDAELLEFYAEAMADRDTDEPE